MRDCFEELTTLEQTKAHFRAMVHCFHLEHPAGDTVGLCERYLAKLKSLDGSGSGSYTYRYNAEVERAVAEKLVEVVRSGVLEEGDLDVFLVGVYLYIAGDTRPHRAKLNALGFLFNGTISKWQWQPARRRWAGKRDFAQVAAAYGADALVQ